MPQDAAAIEWPSIVAEAGMAVFPTARRALSRPSWLPWLIAASVLITASVSIPAFALLGSSSPDEGTSPSIHKSTSIDASSSTASQASPAGATSRPISLISDEQRELLAQLAASDVQMASDEAAFLIADAASKPGYISEASSIRVAGDGTATTAIEEPVAEASSIAVAGNASTAPALTSEVPAPTSEVPATQAQTVPQVAPPPPALPLVQTQLAPVQRWAAAGIVIETEGQVLDDVSLANVDAALSALSPSVLSNLGNPALGPLHILVNADGRVLSGDQPYGGPANFFSTNEGRNELVLYPQQSVYTIVHELGHAYNLRRIDAGRYAMVLLDPEMRSFLAATGWNITSTDSQIQSAVDHMHVDYTYTGSFHWPRLSNDDPLEDFANSFASFFLDPAGLQHASPERYAWMLATFGR